MKRKKSEPALNPESVKKRSGRIVYDWTDKLKRILIQGYKLGGDAKRSAIRRIQSLTGWPKHVCWSQARKLGLAKNHVRHEWPAELDALLKSGYSNGPVEQRSAIREIQSITGWPRHVCWDRARKLQLTRNHHETKRAWSEAEDKYLLDFIGSQKPRQIARRLKRSVKAVRHRLRQLGRNRKISARVQDGYTIAELAEYLGRGSKTIQGWINRGWLKARYEGNGREDGAARIMDEDFRIFWKQHPYEVPLHRLSREGLLWFCWVMHDIPPSDDLHFGDPLDRKRRREQRKQEQDALDEEDQDL